MRRWMAAPLVLAVAIGLTSVETRRAAAQPKDGPVAEKFKTADGVELHSLFHPANPMVAKNAASTPVIVLMYPPGPDRDMTKGEWGGLTKELTNAGYHVFQFDWRGHGKSTTITNTKTFWGNSYLNGGNANFNGYIKGGPPKMPLKAELSVKADLGANVARHMPAYLNDLAAVRYHLDTKNDNNELNSSSIYVIGAGDAAALGTAWIASEWQRQRTYPNVIQLGVPRYEFVPQQLNGGLVAGSEAGNDFGGAVWLTATRPTSFTEFAMKGWITKPNLAPMMRENNPMLFLYADKDTKGKGETNFYYNEMLIAEPKGKGTLVKLKQTFAQPVEKAGTLQGVKLLGEKFGTEKLIIEYLAARQKEREKIAPKKRGYNDPYYIDVRAFGLFVR